MPIYISRGRFTTDAIKGMMAKAENREEAVSNLFESVGGRLIGWYLTFGRGPQRHRIGLGRHDRHALWPQSGRLCQK
jgi:hypothetical protein